MSGDMPEGWSTLPFAEAVEINPRRRLPREGLVPFLDMASLPLSGADVSVLAVREVSSGGSKFQSGDTLFARITPCAENGKLGFVRSIEGGAVAQGSTEFIVMGARDGFTLPEYVRYLAGWPQVREHAIGLMEGTSGRQRVPNWAFGEIEVPVPPLDEQRRIAEVLRSVDDTLGWAESVSEQAEVAWQALVEDLIWARLDDRPEFAGPLGDALAGSDYGVNASLTGEQVGHAVLRMGNLQNGWIDPTDLKWADIAEDEAHALRLSVGDILFNRTNSRDLVGKVALVREPTDFLYASYIVRLRVDHSKADPYYLFAAMHSRRAQSRFKSIATPGVSQSNINPTNLKKQIVPLPGVPEQKEVAAQLRSVEAVRRKALEEVETLRLIKLNLTRDLLSGRVRVPA